MKLRRGLFLVETVSGKNIGDYDVVEAIRGDFPVRNRMLNANLCNLCVLKYSWKACDVHLPSFCMSDSNMPLFDAVCAAPRRKLWPV